MEVDFEINVVGEPLTVGSEAVFYVASDFRDDAVRAGYDNFQWTVDGRGAGTDEEFTLQFSEPGRQSVAVMISNAQGDSITSRRELDVENQSPPKPLSVFPFEPAGVIGQPLALEVTPGAEGYTWFRESGESFAYRSNIIFQPERASETLRVEGADGGSAEVRVTAVEPPEVAVPPQIEAFVLPAGPKLPEIVDRPGEQIVLSGTYVIDGRPFTLRAGEIISENAMAPPEPEPDVILPAIPRHAWKSPAGPVSASPGSE